MLMQLHPWQLMTHWVQPQDLQLQQQLPLLEAWLWPWGARSCNTRLQPSQHSRRQQQQQHLLLQRQWQQLLLQGRQRLTCWVVMTCTCPTVSAQQRLRQLDAAADTPSMYQVHSSCRMSFPDCGHK